MQILIVTILALIVLSASAYDEIRCKTNAKKFQMAHKIIAKKLKPELVLEALCKKSAGKMKGCDNLRGAVLALKSLAAQHAFCDVRDPHNVKGQYAKFLPKGSSNSTVKAVKGVKGVKGVKEGVKGWYDDDYDDIWDDDDIVFDDAFIVDDDDAGCNYDCGDQCTYNVMETCMDSCGAVTADCADVEDIYANPACYAAAQTCFLELGGTCCTCGCYYRAYCCYECGL